MLLCLSGVTAAFATYTSYLDQLPDPATLAAMEPPLDSHVYARDGQLLATLHDPNFRHLHATLPNISRWVIDATVDVEDRHFYEQASWDLPRIIKAGIDDLKHNAPVQGASTITEQLAKISFLPSERSWERKVKQFILGVEIESDFSKQQILEMYLNRIYYGNHAIGIETAAQLFFHKSAKDLDLAEATMLVGLPNAPVGDDPRLHGPDTTVNPKAKQRQHDVLHAMVVNKDITQQQADKAYEEPLTYHDSQETETRRSPYFVQYLEDYLTQTYGSAYTKPGGWEITSSLDINKQGLAEQTVHAEIEKDYLAFNARDASLVSMDPMTGEVLAMVGHWDENDPNLADIRDLNLATSQMTPGSTIKLFTYTAAIASKQFTMNSSISANVTRFDNGTDAGYTPQNYDRQNHGYCLLPACLGNSFNVPAVAVEKAVGVPYITNLEIAAGLTSLNDAPDANGHSNRPEPQQLSATLGSLYRGVTPLELADGASTIANLGVQHDPAPVLTIVDRASGKQLYKYDPATTAKRVVPENVAFIMNEITSNNANRLTEFTSDNQLTLPDRRVSAKTGTSDYFINNWTVGWTPQLLTVVMIGNATPNCLQDSDRPTLDALGEDTGRPYNPDELNAFNQRYNLNLQPVNGHCGDLSGVASGVTGAAPIWHDYMQQALVGVPAIWYTKPADVVQRGGNDDGYFFLPGTGTPTCSYNAPTQDFGNPCEYLGPAPAPSPTPSKTTPTPTKPTPTPEPTPTAPPTPTPTPIIPTPTP